LLKVGLTGGIASGKSAVGEMFAALGAYLIQADQIAHELMGPGQPVYQEVVEHFGTAILNSDRTVNRARLAELAFGSSSQTAPSEAESRIEELNRIVHPAVIQRQNQWLEDVGGSDPQAIAIVEAALILEAGADKSLDRLIVVTCRPEQRIQRWASRVGQDQQTAKREVLRRMAAQFPDELKIKAADYVIDNSGPLDSTRKQVEEIFRRLKLDANNQRPRTND
jgi:dephospho-CoA kinase